MMNVISKPLERFSTFLLIIICTAGLRLAYGASANNITEAGEACDGTDLSGNTCATLQGFSGGTLKCKADRSGYDVSGCIAGTVKPALNACDQNTVQTAINAATV